MNPCRETPSIESWKVHQGARSILVSKVLPAMMQASPLATSSGAFKPLRASSGTILISSHVATAMMVRYGEH